MIGTYYAVKDELTNHYFTPLLMMSDEEALRQFKSQVNNIPLWKDNPSDWSLYKIGQFDDETGTLTSDLTWPKKVASGRSVLNA